MMIRYSELKAKKESMDRLSDPRQDIIGSDGSAVRDEVEDLRKVERVDIPQSDPEKKQSSSKRVNGSEQEP